MAETETKRNLVAELVERNFTVRAGELLVGGVPIDEIVRQHGTPLFVYDEQTLARQYQALRSALPGRFTIHYSVKANPNQAIIRSFLGQGAGLEIASAGELHQALSAGCPAERILFAGPGKTEEELRAALSAGIGEIHAESLLECQRIARLAEGLHRRAKISLRVNPSAAVEGGGLRMGAKPVAFGIDEDQVDAVVDRVLKMPTIEIVGLHLFMGTQILDAATLLTQYQAGLEIGRKLAARIGRPLETIDFGGGLGIPYFPHEHTLDLVTLKSGLAPMIEALANDPLLGTARFIVEPGRFLVGEAGIYVSRVNDVKISRGKKFAIVDGGMHHHLAASGNLGQTIKRNFPVAVLNKLDQPASENIEVVGPLCTPLDVLARGIDLPAVEVGDLIGVFQSGAYARAASPLGFLSHPSPAEVLVQNGQFRLVRRRGKVEDYLAGQV
jgi:diaminopimelate decarboxylase